MDDGIRLGCVVRNKKRPEIKVWLVAYNIFDFSDADYIGVSLKSIPYTCQIGNAYAIDPKMWEATGEFYDVAEVVTKMQEVKNNG